VENVLLDSTVFSPEMFYRGSCVKGDSDQTLVLGRRRRADVSILNKHGACAKNAKFTQVVT